MRCCKFCVFCYCSDVFLEKHWKSVIHRSICDYFFEAQSKVGILLDFSGTVDHNLLIP